MSSRIRTYLLICMALANALHGQLAPEIAAGVASPDWTVRMDTYNRLAAETARSRDEDTAIIALLQRETSILLQPSLDGPRAKGEAYSEYAGALLVTVMGIAEKEPERSDVWRSLANCGHDGTTSFGKWLATHSDKTAILLKECAVSPNELFRGQGLTSLAQIVAYERQPGTIHHLNPKDVDSLDAMVREGLNDSNVYDRMSAIMALGIMGTQDDIAVLEKIAATDPYIDPQIAAQGPPSRPYLVREYSLLVIKRLRAKLKAQQ